MNKHDPTFTRAFPVTVERTGTHQLTGRLVPYNKATLVADPNEDGTFEIYQEGFRPGAFKAQVNSTEPGVARRIGLIHRHEGGLGFLGPFTALRDMPDGLYGDVRILPTKADDVLALLEEGVNELSVEFRLHKVGSTEEVGGVRWRTGAHLDQVALEPKGAYDARVTAYRAEVDQKTREEAEAEAQRKATEEAEAAEAAKQAELATAAEAEAEAAKQRKVAWDELAARVEDDRAKQDELVKTYGVTQLPARPH